MGVGLRSPRPKGYEAYGLCDAGTGGGVSEAEFEDQAGELVERIELLDGEERIAAACRGSANPAALQWIADTLSISSEHTVADLGAGLGGPAGWLRQQAGCDVIASDPSWPALDGARRLFGLRAIQATADASPFGDDSRDVVLLLGVLSVERAFASIGWTTVVLVGGMIPLSTAMRVTGAAESLAEQIVDLVGDAGPYALLVALFVLTAVLGQLISNMATALIVIPIALSAAAELDVATAPVLMSLNVATSAALLTPVATPANLMVMEPGGYRFNDYWKLGSVVMAWFFVVGVVLVPLIWSF